jgi:hypothetical protein
MNVNFTFSQNTNVDLLYFKENWAQSDLKVNKFRNGKLITEVKSLDEWGEQQNESNSKKELFIKYKVENNEFYVYNFRCLENIADTLAPVGQRLPTKNDVLLADKILNPIKFGQFYINNSKYNYCCDEPDKQSIWIFDNTRLNEPEASYITFGKDEIIYQIYNTYPKSFGLPVRVISNLKELITRTDSVFSYKDLLPKQYDNLCLEIAKKASIKLTQNTPFNVIGELSTTKNGSKSINLIVNKKNNTDFVPTENENKFENLFTEINGKIELPVYEGFRIQSKSKIDLSLTKEKLRLNFTDYSYKFNDEFFNQINISKGMVEKINPILDAYKIGIKNNLTDKFEFVSGLNSFRKNKMRLYKAIIPGLEKTIPKKNDKKGINKLYFSIPIGGLSLTSFLISNQFYNKYKESKGINEENYKVANFANKVFLTTTGIYIGMVFYDVAAILKWKYLAHKYCKRINKKYDFDKMEISF